jgi:hypothetical protein
MKYRVITSNGIFVTEVEAENLEHALDILEDHEYEVLDAYDEALQIIVADEVYKTSEW